MADGTAAPTTQSAPAAQPTPGAAAPAQVAPVAPLEENWKEKFKSLESELAKKNREHIIERRKWSTTQKTEREGLSSKLSRLQELEKREQLAKLNPAGYLHGVYGEKWADQLREVMINGVPPADMMASEVQRLRDEFEQKLADKDTDRQKAESEASKRNVEQARRALHFEAADFYKANEKDYPIFKRLGDERAVAATLAQRIESEYHRSEKRDPETNEVVLSGKVLTAKEAADLLEADLLALAEDAVSHEKYRPKFQEKLQPAKQAATVATSASNTGGVKQQVDGKQQSSSQQRRTLTNNLTASTPGRTPALTDAERRERALAARNAVFSKAPHP